MYKRQVRFWLIVAKGRMEEGYSVIGGGDRMSERPRVGRRATRVWSFADSCLADVVQGHLPT